jgi:Mitochondrial protein Pet127
MDGVVVAYHNTERMFGFQYIPLEEMDRRLFGPTPGAGDRVFVKCVEMLELIADEITRCFPKQVCSFFPWKCLF